MLLCCNNWIFRLNYLELDCHCDYKTTLEENYYFYFYFKLYKLTHTL